MFLTRADAAAGGVKLATEVYAQFVAGKLNGISCIGTAIHEQRAIENRNEITTERGFNQDSNFTNIQDLCEEWDLV